MSPTDDTTTYGRHFLLQIVDERADGGYNRPFAMYPKSSDQSAGFRSIGYAQMANAVNQVAWWLDSEFPARRRIIHYHISIQTIETRHLSHDFDED
ncbi:hypothetical protein IFR05_006183 [Cadophora sp. M221]|nr:hypothetical protein IFR05_006183 [Cadophora sp. M221]